VRFDCCLVNLYPNGDAACAWHADPDHGRLWSLDECVVSIGETRRFNIRLLPHAAPPGEREQHSFHLRDGDVFWMARDCQDRFEHTVLRGQGPHNAGPRVSLVFKQALLQASGRKGHGGVTSKAKSAAAAATAEEGGGERKARFVLPGKRSNAQRRDKGGGNAARAASDSSWGRRGRK
jgi:hypothetical protein